MTCDKAHKGTSADRANPLYNKAYALRTQRMESFRYFSAADSDEMWV